MSKVSKIVEQILEEKYPEYKKLPIVADINAEENPRDDFFDDLSEKERYDINAEALKKIGKTEYNYLECWEPGRLDTDETIFDFETLYEFDYKWWEFQKNAEYGSIEELKQYMVKGSNTWTPEKIADSMNRFEEKYKNGYSIYMSGDWFRLFDDNDIFLYSQFISLEWYLYYELESFVDNLRESALPYELNDKEFDFQTLLNENDPEKKYKANGREQELDSLQDLIRDYEVNKLSKKIKQTIKNHPDIAGKAFRVDIGYDEKKFDPFTHFIFVDESTLKAIRTKHFLDDFNKLKEDEKVLENILSELKESVKNDFEEFYETNRKRYI